MFLLQVGQASSFGILIEAKSAAFSARQLAIPLSIPALNGFFDCGTLRHELHAGDPGYEDCLACKLQTIQLSPAIRRLSGDPREILDRPSAAPQRHDNAWERGIARDERGVPFLNEKGFWSA